MQQYYDIKEQHPDTILFFRMGDFYEMFHEDAQIAHSVLGIALTTRNKNAPDPIPLAGIPYHAKERYLWQLIDAGYRVAIAEQVSDPKLKWIVKREVARVVTPATLHLESDAYDATDRSQILLSLSMSAGVYGISVLDSVTGRFWTSQLEWFQKICEQIYKLAPSEVVLQKSLFDDIELRDVLQKKYGLNIYFYDSQISPAQILRDFFWVKSLESFGIEGKQQCQISAWQLLEYLQKNQKTDLSFITTLSYESHSWYMQLDESTIRSLDLVYNISTASAKTGTLLGVLDHTKTSMWKRRLREQILHPLQDIKEIKKRHDFIDVLISDRRLLDSIREKLKQVSDIDAILSRLTLNRAGVKDMIHLKNSLKSVVEVYDMIEKSENKKLKKLLS